MAILKGLKSLEGRDAGRRTGWFQSRSALVCAAVVIFCLGVAAAGFLADPGWLFFSQDSKSSVSASSGTPQAALDKARRTPFYTVQLGAYNTQDEVMEIAQRVKATGYPLFLNKDSQEGRERHRIFIGKFKQKKEAEEVAETFKKAKGFSGIRVILTTSLISKVDSP